MKFKHSFSVACIILLCGVLLAATQQNWKEWTKHPSCVVGEFFHHEILDINYLANYTPPNDTTFVFRPPIDSVEIIIRVGFFDVVDKNGKYEAGAKIYKLKCGSPEFIREEVYREGWYKVEKQ